MTANVQNSLFFFLFCLSLSLPPSLPISFYNGEKRDNDSVRENTKQMKEINCLFSVLFWIYVYVVYSFVNTHFHIIQPNTNCIRNEMWWLDVLELCTAILSHSKNVHAYERANKRMQRRRKKYDGKIKIPKKCWKCDKHVFHLNVYKCSFFYSLSLSLSIALSITFYLSSCHALI